jgi:hypothetical protein
MMLKVRPLHSIQTLGTKYPVTSSHIIEGMMPNISQFTARPFLFFIQPFNANDLLRRRAVLKSAVKICVKNQLQQLFIKFINYVWYLLHVSALHCHPQGASLVPSER